MQTTDANNFVAKARGSDSAFDLKWVVPLDRARAVFTNEIDMKDTDRSTKLNGGMIKTLASGGDEMSVRGLHQNIVKFRLQCQFLLMVNDLPECTVKDALLNCKEFQMNSVFVDGEPQENDIVKEYTKDDSIKEYVASEHAVRAFTHVLLKHYSSTKPEEPQQIKEACKDNLEESELNKFKELYNFTKKGEDFMPTKQFNAIL
eukprot:COSAG05_NODE_4936_length_1319_cov_3.210656_2_plen_202_part_01